VFNLTFIETCLSKGIGLQIREFL